MRLMLYKRAYVGCVVGLGHCYPRLCEMLMVGGLRTEACRGGENNDEARYLAVVMFLFRFV